MDFDRTRVDDQIRVYDVRLIDENGAQLGIVSTLEAKKRAKELGLNLVEINPTSRPPVCKIMDFGKYKFDFIKKQKASKQTIVKIKEIKLHPSIQEHDYEYRAKQIREFLSSGDKVKLIMTFRGREITHIDVGRKIIDKIVLDLNDVAIVEQRSQEDRSIVILLKSSERK